MANPVKVFEPNTKGRDFVIGDLHGSFSVLANLLEGLNFDYENDRMFSVGDLVDRGPESLLCLSLLRANWFHAALANHEQLMLQSHAVPFFETIWRRNGGSWGTKMITELRSGDLSEEAEELEELLEYVEELPYMMTVKMEDGRKFHIIHAEMLPRGIKVTDEFLEDDVNVFRLAQIPTENGDAFCWSRNLFYDFRGKDLTRETKASLLRCVAFQSAYQMFNPELSHIISGHTIMKHPLTLGGQTNIDTGAYMSYPLVDNYGKSHAAPDWCALTCVELKTWKFYQATPTEFREVEPITLTMEEIHKTRFPLSK